MADYAIWMFIAYLLGSISSAIIVCKLFNLPDPRTEGSGNPGATNVARIAGKKLAALVLLGDALKGFIPTVMVHYLFQLPMLTGLTALAAFIGHIYPVFFKFKGGKGVATAMGGLWGLAWMYGACFTGVWLLFFAFTRTSSIAALLATSVTTFWIFLSEGFIVSIPIIIMAVIIFWRHRENIKRLLGGTETKI
ncbi:MAG: glycerol-3-phosphate 1-O-acyltransferase PlsY [Gammaproteobacteria bacterium]|jgi:glycerol-3-phosphate acyltransferase PlsY